MAHYLDPKNDLVFKKIFGEHPDLLISFLNALMPLEPGRLIESVEYLPGELVPENPAKKFSIVDVRCKDNFGRQFIVEMQMEWSTAFTSRMLFNASKAYVRQLNRKQNYGLLQPVYGLGIINENFDHKTPEFYHRYQIMNCQNLDEVVEGIELILIELLKFKPEKWADRKMAVLWMRFLREIEDQTTKVAEELLENEDIRKALDICEEGGFTPEELALYEQYWDAILKERLFLSASHAEGKAEGKAEVAVKCAGKGMTVAEIADLTGLSVNEIAAVLKSHNL
jgi:predicted transposase/invertase (TIGR01784 family)